MANVTNPGEPTGDQNWAASFYRWEVAGKPITILLSLDLVDRLERESLESFRAANRRGSEIGGVLGGRVIAGSQPTVIVERFEPVECDYSCGALYALSGADKARVKQAIERIAGAGGVSVAGFFRSHARRGLVLDEEDQAVAKEFFSDPNHVFLLVRPQAVKPCVGGFLFWEKGQLATASYQEFPFKRAELSKNVAVAPRVPVARQLQATAKPGEHPKVSADSDTRNVQAAKLPSIPLRMGLACIFGHKWAGLRCKRCGKRRKAIDVLCKSPSYKCRSCKTTGRHIADVEKAKAAMMRRMNAGICLDTNPSVMLFCKNCAAFICSTCAASHREPNKCLYCDAYFGFDSIAENSKDPSAMLDLVAEHIKSLMPYLGSYK